MDDRLRGGWVLLLMLVLWPLLPAVAQAAQNTIAQVDARAEVAAALHAASATQAAALKVADAKMRAQRGEIERLRAQVRAGDKRLQAALTGVQEGYIADLAARDRAYAQEIAVFRAAVQDIAASAMPSPAL